MIGRVFREAMSLTTSSVKAFYVEGFNSNKSRDVHGTHPYCTKTKKCCWFDIPHYISEVRQRGSFIVGACKDWMGDGSFICTCTDEGTDAHFLCSCNPTLSAVIKPLESTVLSSSAS